MTWDIFFWVMSGIGGVIVLLLGALAFFVRMDRRETREHIAANRERLDKHDEKFDRVHEEIKELTVTTSRAIAVLETRMSMKRK